MTPLWGDMFTVALNADEKMHELAGRLERSCSEEGVQKIVVGAVITNEKNEVLIVKRAAMESFMAELQEIPSGTVESGESVSDSLRRETLEETGLQIKQVTAYLGSFDYLSKSKRVTRQLNFSASVQNAENVAFNAQEHDSFAWMSPEAVAQSGCSEQTKRVLLCHFPAPN